MQAPSVLPALAALALAVPAAHAGPDVTIYSQDLGFVREIRALAPRTAVDTLRLEDVSTRLDFTSVRLAPRHGRVRRLAYRWDVATGDDLLEGARGQRVRVVSRGDRVSEGTLLSSDGSWMVLRADDGSLSTLARSTVEAVQMAKPSAALALRPAIEAVVEDARGDAELSYLTGGLSWSAEHTLVRTGETTATWSTTVQLVNSTGRDYRDARVRLVAGEPSRASAPMPKAIMPMMARATDAMGGAAPDMTEASFADYHLYTLREPATLRDRETQSLVMIEPKPIAISPRYVYRGDARGVLSQLEFVNSVAAGPGVPVPGGRVRVFQADDSGALQFTGEATLSHTAVDEKRTVDVGYAFDLPVERKIAAERRPSDREREYDVEVRLRNRRKVPARIAVEEGVSGDTTVLRSSLPAVRKDASTLRFDVDVAAGGETVLTYTARQRW
jgi:hypothetical protein